MPDEPKCWNVCHHCDPDLGLALKLDLNLT